MRTIVTSLAALAMVAFPALARPSPTSGRTAGASPAPANGVAQRLRGAPYSMPTDPPFGAACDGVTDDTAALRAWLGAASPTNSHLRLPPSTCVFKGPLVVPRVNYLTIEGAGKQSKLEYDGTATTGTMLTIGRFGDSANSHCSVIGLTIKNIRLISAVTMTAGDALMLGDLCEAQITDLSVGGDLDGNQGWFNALHINGGNNIYIKGYELSGNNAGEVINGYDAAYPLNDLMQIQGKIAKGRIGLLAGGAVGNILMDQTDILGNGTQVQIDQSVVPHPNGLFFFGPAVTLDVTGTTPGHAGIDLNIDDPGSTTLGSQVFLSGSWIASAQAIGGVANSGTCIVVGAAATNWSLHFNGGALLNCAVDGIRIDNANANVILNGTRIQQNARYGVNATVATGNVRLGGVSWPTNGYLNGRNIANGNIAGTDVFNRMNFLPWGGWTEGQTSRTGFGGANEIAAYNDGKGGRLSLNGGAALGLGVGGRTYLRIGDGLAGTAFDGPVRQTTGTFGALGACDATSRGTIAAIGDAAAAITAWHQPVTAGGGAHYALLLCNGSGWHAIGY